MRSWIANLYQTMRRGITAARNTSATPAEAKGQGENDGSDVVRFDFTLRVPGAVGLIFEAERLNTEENAADAIEMIDLWLGFPDAPDDKAWCEAACGRLDELSKDSVAFPPESGLTNHDLMMLVMELRGRCFVMYLSSHVGSKEVVHRARRHATLIILLKPDDPHFLSIAARIFALIDDVPTALNTVGRALAINPKHQESLETKRLIGTLGRGNE